MAGTLNSSVTYPSIVQILIFRGKATLFQLRRSLLNRFTPIQRYKPANNWVNAAVIAESVTPLWTSHEVHEQNLIAGKIHNLRLAAQCIHGIELPANAPFSFWAQLGRPTASRGYVNGRELRQGCVIPSVGGGLCQLSNALYSAALDAGLDIVERHAHTQIMPGSLAEIGRDATVFWNYVDLRFKTAQPLRIESILTDEMLIVQLKGQADLVSETVAADREATRPVAKSQSCQTCGVTACSRKSSRPTANTAVAYLLDEYWPEFDAWIQQQRQANDLLAIPLNGQQWRRPNYAWNMTGFGQVKQARRVTLQRALASRQLAAQGKARQQQLIQSDQQLANFYAAQLDYRMLHAVIMQNLLPFLWQTGHLGGRSFDVLMTRLPLFALQDRLDQAHRQHPESSTLNDFRVDGSRVEAERQALTAARTIITPHRAIAALFPEKTVLLNWQLPTVETAPVPGNAILFPAATLGRKGVYELRQAVQNLGLNLRLLGQPLEDADFWEGVATEAAAADPLAGVGLVVLPAYVEHRPRLLLRAIAAGIPVIASEACGLGDRDGVITIPSGDRVALQQALAQFCT